ncbi:MAG: 50S ribosomal protein L18 [Dehalococcoidales bacterium]|nr:50S ribosomal protein L18 [Dehalococcoidales bacterium]
MSKINKREARKHRHVRVRAKVEGSEARPRLSVFRSLSHIYAQVINDSAGNTIASASTLDVEIKGQLEGKKKSEEAKIVGSIVANRAIEKGVKEVVFDRGGFKYQGRVKAMADGAREAGLKF